MTLQHTTQPGNGSGRNETRDYLLLTSGKLTWALPATSVEEIFYLENLTPLPLVPAGIEGVTNLRGVVVPVVNLVTLVEGRKRPTPKHRDIRCVLLDDEGLRMGLIVADIHRIHRVALSSHREQDGDLSRCVLDLGDKQAAVLDFERLVSRVRGDIRREMGLRGLSPDDDATQEKAEP